MVVVLPRNERCARNYSPDTGRFLSEDPIGFNSSDLNLYRYVLSSPIGATDPKGLDTYQCETPILGGLASHTYVCVDGVCDGLSPVSDSKISGLFFEQDSQVNGGGPSPGTGAGGSGSSGGGSFSCTKVSKKKCVDKCAMEQFMLTKPKYNLKNGEHCGSWANSVINSCLARCLGEG